MNGLSLFLRQTLDAMDGKQARRTNQSSALGEFFDHGLCDAIEILVSCPVASNCLIVDLVRIVQHGSGSTSWIWPFVLLFRRLWNGVPFDGNVGDVS